MLWWAYKCYGDTQVLDGICTNLDLRFSGHLSLCAHFLLDMKHASLHFKEVGGLVLFSNKVDGFSSSSLFIFSFT
jgi:hypothetical protein